MPTPFPPFDADARRAEIADDTASTALAAAARHLAQAVADYEDALDRRVNLNELKVFDEQVALAERSHVEALRAWKARPDTTAGN